MNNLRTDEIVESADVCKTSRSRCINNTGGSTFTSPITVCMCLCVCVCACVLGGGGGRGGEQIFSGMFSVMPVLYGDLCNLSDLVPSMPVY